MIHQVYTSTENLKLHTLFWLRDDFLKCQKPTQQQVLSIKDKTKETISGRRPLEQVNKVIVIRAVQAAENTVSKTIRAANLPLGAGGELGSGLAGDFGLLLFGLGLIPRLGARLLRRSRLPLFSIWASPTGVRAIVRPRLHLTGHADTANTQAVLSTSGVYTKTHS